MSGVVKCKERCTGQLFRVICTKEGDEEECEVCEDWGVNLPDRATKGFQNLFEAMCQMTDEKAFLMATRTMSKRVTMFDPNEGLGYFKRGKAQGSYRLCFGLIPGFEGFSQTIAITNWYLHREDQERDVVSARNRCRNKIEEFKRWQKIGLIH